MQVMEISSWADFKSLVAAKALLLQYSDVDNYYSIFAPEAQVFLWHINVIKETVDATDFETNFKPTANSPLEIKAMAGRPIRMSMSPQPLNTYNKWKGHQAIMEPGMTYTFIDVSWPSTVYFRGGYCYTDSLDADDYVSADVVLATNDQVVMSKMIETAYLSNGILIPFISDESMAFPSYLKLRVNVHCPNGLSETEVRSINILTEYFQ